jgi:hypothetical protein
MLRRTLAPLALLAAVAACSRGSDGGGDRETAPTPIDAWGPDRVTLARGPFCDLVPDSAVERALGEEVTTAHYGNGETAAVTDGVRDVAHEFGCGYVAPGGETARAWLFAPPVTPAQANAVVEGVRRTRGCRLVTGHDFGDPGTGSVCVSTGRTRAAYRGLFGDAWFSCELAQGGAAAPAARRQLLQDAGEWCVSVVEAVRGAE